MLGPKPDFVTCAWDTFLNVQQKRNTHTQGGKGGRCVQEEREKDRERNGGQSIEAERDTPELNRLK